MGNAKSAYKPSGSSGQSLSRSLQHEATRSIVTPPWMGCWSIAGLPPPSPALNSPDLFIHFGGERHFENRSSRPKPQSNVLGQLRSRTQTARSGDEDTNQGTAHLPDPRSTDRRCWFIYKPHPLSSVEALYNSLIQDQGSLPSTKCLQTEEIIQREVFQDLSKI